MALACIRPLAGERVVTVRRREGRRPSGAPPARDGGAPQSVPGGDRGSHAGSPGGKPWCAQPSEVSGAFKSANNSSKVPKLLPPPPGATPRCGREQERRPDATSRGTSRGAARLELRPPSDSNTRGSINLDDSKAGEVATACFLAMALAGKPRASGASRPPKVQWPRAPTRAMSLRTDSVGGISWRSAESSSGPAREEPDRPPAKLGGVACHEPTEAKRPAVCVQRRSSCASSCVPREPTLRADARRG